MRCREVVWVGAVLVLCVRGGGERLLGVFCECLCVRAQGDFIRLHQGFASMTRAAGQTTGRMGQQARTCAHNADATAACRIAHTHICTTRADYTTQHTWPANTTHMASRCTVKGRSSVRYRMQGCGLPRKTRTYVAHANCCSVHAHTQMCWPRGDETLDGGHPPSCQSIPPP